MVKAVESGEISSARLDESVLKLLKTKASLGLQQARLVDITTIAAQSANRRIWPSDSKLPMTPSRWSATTGKCCPLKVVGTSKGGLPYMTTEEIHNHVVVVVFSDDVRMTSGRVFERQVRSRVPDANVLYVDPRIAGEYDAGCAQGSR